MTWTHYPLMALLSLLIWFAASLLPFIMHPRRRIIAVCLSLIGIAIYLSFPVGLWYTYNCPPMRTVCDTRMWYVFFLMLSGIVVFYRLRYRWMLLLSSLLSSVFIILNILADQSNVRPLMPILRSMWFVPHVAVYIFSYGILGCAAMMSMAGIIRRSSSYIPHVDTLMRISMIFLSMGMLSGCVWAKQAWGEYWSWDPKETWAAATWLVCVAYVHRSRAQASHVAMSSYLLVILAFLLLQMCWYGVNLLPSASGSLHRYG